MDSNEMLKSIELMKLDGRFNINYQDKYGYTLFEYAVEKGDQKLKNILLRAGADPNLVNSEGTATYTPLISAIMEENIEKFKLLLEDSRFDRNVRLSNGLTTLTLASQKGLYPMVELLLNDPQITKATINMPDDMGQTALHYVSAVHDVKLIQLLIKKGANPDIKDNYGRPALPMEYRDILLNPKEKEEFKPQFNPNRK